MGQVALDMSVYERLDHVSWFSHCGDPAIPQLPFECEWVKKREDALRLLTGNNWFDVKTQADGDLSGYLAKTDYASYGGVWNKMARQSLTILAQSVRKQVAEAMAVHGIDEKLLQRIMFDIGEAVMEISYRHYFPKVPVFFEHLLLIYEAGRLPCGWTEPVKKWPDGKAMAF